MTTVNASPTKAYVGRSATFALSTRFNDLALLPQAHGAGTVTAAIEILLAKPRCCTSIDGAWSP